jgi:hypothetical protein
MCKFYICVAYKEKENFVNMITTDITYKLSLKYENFISDFLRILQVKGKLCKFDFCVTCTS